MHECRGLECAFGERAGAWLLAAVAMSKVVNMSVPLGPR